MVEIPVLDKGFVRLDDVMASDLSVVNSARVSFNKRHEEMEQGDERLINYLLKNRHGTPFEHNSFRFHVKAPLFVVREWQRHRVGSFNEWSARYSKLEPDFYVPQNVRQRTEDSKPGQYQYEPVDEKKADIFRSHVEQENKRAYQFYESWMKDVAAEQARIFLPLGIYTQMYWTVNARSLMNFISLRNAPTAQWEMQQYAQAVEYLFGGYMPITCECFIDNGRVAP